MSASSQKKARSSGSLEKAEKKAAAELEAAQKSRKFRRNTIIVVVVVLLVLAASLFINSNYLYTKAAAVQVGGTKYSAVEFDYYYRSIVNQFYEDNSDYLAFYLDTSSPLDEQTYIYSDDENYTWADYFTEQTESSLQQTTIMYDEAKANGYTLSDEDYSTIDSTVSYISLTAASSGYNLDTYLALVYGKGMNEARYRECMERYLIANGYAQELTASFTYTDEELDAYYAENLKDTYDRITYLYKFFATSNTVYDDIEGDEAKMAAAQADCEEIAAAATDVDAFVEAVVEHLSEADAAVYGSVDSMRYTTWAYALNSAYKDWLMDEARQEGDTYVVESGAGVYVLYFINHDDNDYNMVNVRHILVAAEADKSGEYTEDALAAAEAKAQLLYSMWLADPTEDYFAELANTNSDDSGSNTVGGLYENVYKGQMVEEFDAFCFAGHEYGDTAIVYGESDAYAGYHIIFYVGEGDNFADYITANELRSVDYSAYIEARIADYPVTEKAALRFAQVA